VQLAAHQIALQCASVSFMVPLGLAQAATVRVGLAAGAGDRQGILRAGLMALVMGGAFMLAMATLMWTAPVAIVGLFVDAEDPANAAVVHAAVTFLTVAALFQIFDGGQVIGAGALRGLKDTRWPMAFAAFAYWAVGGTLALALGFGAGLGGLGVWLGLASSLAVAAALMIGRFLALQHRGRRVPAAKSAASQPPIAWRRSRASGHETGAS
jgi:MATE family multidrug resistance protein